MKINFKLSTTRAITVFIALAIIIASSILGASVYYSSINSKSNTQSSSTMSKSSTSSVHSSSSSSSLTSSSSSSSSSGPYYSDLGDLYGNFSQLEIAFSSNYAGYIDNGTLYYNVLNYHALNESNDLNLAIVNITYTSESTSGTISSANYLVYYNSAWEATGVTVSGANVTGTNGEAIAQGLTAYFQNLFIYQNPFVNAKLLSELSQGSSKLQTFGGVQLNVTTYTGSNLSDDGNIITSMQVNVGQVTHLELFLLTELSESYTGSAGNGSYSFSLLSATAV